MDYLRLDWNYFEIWEDYLESRDGYGCMKKDIVVDNKRYPLLGIFGIRIQKKSRGWVRHGGKLD